MGWTAVSTTRAFAGAADPEGGAATPGSGEAVGERTRGHPRAARVKWTPQDRYAWDAVRASFLDCVRKAEEAGVTPERASQIARELFATRRAG